MLGHLDGSFGSVYGLSYPPGAGSGYRDEHRPHVIAPNKKRTNPGLVRFDMTVS